MTLLRLYRLAEAGVQNSPVGGPHKKKKSAFRHANGGSMPSSDDEDEDDDLGPDLDYDDPSPGEDGPSKDPPEDDPAPDDEPPTPFAAKSAPPSKALQGGKGGLEVKADKATLEALSSALESVRTKDDDLQDWVDDCIREISRAARSGADSVTLPKFEATPHLDDFDDDTGDEEDY